MPTSIDRLHKKEEFEKKYQSFKITIISKDLSKPNSAKELFDEIKQKYQLNIDFLINNARAGQRGKIWETDFKKDIDVIHLNVITTVTLTELILLEIMEEFLCLEVVLHFNHRLY